MTADQVGGAWEAWLTLSGVPCCVSVSRAPAGCSKAGSESSCGGCPLSMAPAGCSKKHVDDRDGHIVCHLSMQQARAPMPLPHADCKANSTPEPPVAAFQRHAAWLESDSSPAQHAHPPHSPQACQAPSASSSPAADRLPRHAGPSQLPSQLPVQPPSQLAPSPSQTVEISQQLPHPSSATQEAQSRPARPAAPASHQVRPISLNLMQILCRSPAGRSLHCGISSQHQSKHQTHLGCCPREPASSCSISVSKICCTWIVQGTPPPGPRGTPAPPLPTGRASAASTGPSREASPAALVGKVTKQRTKRPRETPPLVRPALMALSFLDWRLMQSCGDDLEEACYKILLRSQTPTMPIGVCAARAGTPRAGRGIPAPAVLSLRWLTAGGQSLVQHLTQGK